MNRMLVQFAHHECNAHCFGGQHAEVVWVRHDHAGAGVAEAYLAAMCVGTNVRFVGLHAAPEARWRWPDARYGGLDRASKVTNLHDPLDPADYTARLFIWQGGPMAEQIDDTERRLRLKELQLAYLRGDITLAEHDRRRARYEPAEEAPVAPRATSPDRRKVSKFGQWLGRWVRHKEEQG